VSASVQGARRFAPMHLMASTLLARRYSSLTYHAYASIPTRLPAYSAMCFESMIDFSCGSRF
jgi:hypothetical protein